MSMRISKIQIKHFRAFRGEYTIDLSGGKNLLVYGENGSGKSTLYQALNLFFAPATPFAEQRNRFVEGDDGYVKLEIDDGTNSAMTYEWEQTTHPYGEVLIAAAARTKGFLDYRSLLETHYVHRREDSIDIFDLLVNTLLAYVENPITRKPLADEWASIEQLLGQRRTARRDDRLNQAVSDFVAGMTALLTDLETRANEILSFFGQNVTFQLRLASPGLQVGSSGKNVDNRSVFLTATYYGQSIPRHHHYLNEARLSAIAISIYLGALLLNPPSQLRVLFLDDVLIGLDMSNRLPLLDILTQRFADWQVILTTYDRVWFEMAGHRLKGINPEWKRIELFCGASGEGDLPIYHERKDYLAVAKQHLDNQDLKAAAVYIRSAYERAVKQFCVKRNLAVRYCENHKKQKSEDFWKVVKQHILKYGVPVVRANLVNKIELYRSSVLNELAHTEPVNPVRAEIEAAYKVVEELKTELEKIEKQDL